MLHALRRRLSGPSADEQVRAGDRRQPVVPVVVELGASGWQVIEQHSGLKDTVIRDVVAALRRHLRALGIPGHPEVQLRPIPGATDALRLLVHGRRCGQPNERVAEVLGCLAGTERRSLSEVPVQDVARASPRSVRRRSTVALRCSWDQSSSAAIKPPLGKPTTLGSASRGRRANSGCGPCWSR